MKIPEPCLEEDEYYDIWFPKSKWESEPEYDDDEEEFEED